MDLLNLNYADFERFMYVFFRVGAFVVFVPILGSRQFPTLAKIGFILLLSFSVFPLIDPRFLPQPQGMLDLSVYLFTEFLIGLSIAFATRLVFTAVQIAGTMVDFQMGFGVVNVIDPQTETQVSVTAQFQNIFTILIYLALNAHHLTIFALLESFQQINIMEFSFGALSAAFIMKLFTSTFIIAIKIAAPVMAILFLSVSVWDLLPERYLR